MRILEWFLAITSIIWFTFYVILELFWKIITLMGMIFFIFGVWLMLVFKTLDVNEMNASERAWFNFSRLRIFKTKQEVEELEQKQEMNNVKYAGMMIVAYPLNIVLIIFWSAFKAIILILSFPIISYGLIFKKENIIDLSKLIINDNFWTWFKKDNEIDEEVRETTLSKNENIEIKEIKEKK